MAERRSVLGIVNHMTKFLPMIVEETQPLRELLHSDVIWYWDQQHENTFPDLKAVFSTTPVLAYYDSQANLTLSTDASSYGP